MSVLPSTKALLPHQRHRQHQGGTARAKPILDTASLQILGASMQKEPLNETKALTRTFQQVVFGHLLTSKRLFIDTSWKVLVQSLTVYV